MHRHTCATLLRGDVQVVGIVIGSRSGARLRLRHLSRWVARYGILRTGGQLAARLLDRICYGRRNARALRKIVNDAENKRIIEMARIPVLRTHSYSDPDILAAIERLQPDWLVVHSPLIVGRRVRHLVRGRVLGGHPGVTPLYRGSYSAFWAILFGDTANVGWTVFLIDDGIDTGPVITQQPLQIGPEDTHMTLTWRAMAEEARAQVRVLRALDAGNAVSMAESVQASDDTYYTVPGLKDWLRYWWTTRGGIGRLR